MKKLRILSILLILALFAGMLSGCNTQDSTLEVLQAKNKNEVIKILGKPDYDNDFGGESSSIHYSGYEIADVKGNYSVSFYNGSIERAYFTVSYGGDGTSREDMLDKAEADHKTLTKYLFDTYGGDQELSYDPHENVYWTAWEVENSGSPVRIDYTYYPDGLGSMAESPDAEPDPEGHHTFIELQFRPQN